MMMIMDHDQAARRFSRWFFIAISLSALILCPHSKVEESFPLQATHDLYYHGFLASKDSYDHLKYPGVVPRTFLGSSVLALLCRIFSLLTLPWYNLADHPMQVQFLARFFLMSFVLHGWFRLAARQATTWRGVYLLLVTAVQFHMPFYASRMLPNTFALVLVLHAYADWFAGKVPRSAVWLVAATAIFRCDILLLLGSIGLLWLFYRKLSILQALRIGVTTGIVSLVLTVPLDSHLWNYWVWPEGMVFYYNTILGKSSEWGTSPWHWYLTSALPKGLLLTALLIPLALIRIPERLVALWEIKPFQTSLWDASLLEYLLPIFGFIGLYSCLGHKEMRFIFPAMPILNIAAAAGIERLHRLAFPTQCKDKEYSNLARLFWALAVLLLLVTLLVSAAFVTVSRSNYPGGVALQLLQQHIQESQLEQAKVHVDVAASMTGVSLFGQHATGFSFAKAGYEAEHAQLSYNDFTHLLSEHKEVESFRVVAAAPGNPRLDWRHGRVATQDAIFVHERNDLDNSVN
jgi:alpha-1,6-mannosyltransferase